MSIKKLSKEVLDVWVANLIANTKVIAVQAKGDRFDFDVLESGADLRLDHDVTLQPPTKCFTPPKETLLTCNIGGAYKSSFDEEPFILLGVHPYDMVAINQMDELFRQDNCDIHYCARRDNATIIVCDVVTASKDVFASSMGTATVKEGYDILLTDIGGSYIADSFAGSGQFFLISIANGDYCGIIESLEAVKVHPTHKTQTQYSNPYHISPSNKLSDFFQLRASKIIHLPAACNKNLLELKTVSYYNLRTL